MYRVCASSMASQALWEALWPAEWLPLEHGRLGLFHVRCGPGASSAAHLWKLASGLQQSRSACSS